MIFAIRKGIKYKLNTSKLFSCKYMYILAYFYLKRSVKIPKNHFHIFMELKDDNVQYFEQRILKYMHRQSMYEFLVLIFNFFTMII